MLGQKIGIQLFSQLALGGLGIVTTTLVARFAGVEVLGTIGYLFGVLGLLSMFSDLGYAQAHIKSVAQGNDLGKSNGTLIAIYTFLIGAFLLLSLIYLFLSSKFNFAFFLNSQLRTVFVILLFSQVFSYFGQTLLLTFQAKQEMAKLNFVLITSKIARFVATVIIAFFVVNTITVGLTFLIESIVILTLSIVFFSRLPLKVPDIFFLKSYTKYALPLMISLPITYFNGNIDKILLNHFWNTKEVGYYFAIFGIIAMAQTFSGAAMTLFFPELVKATKNGFKHVEKITAIMVKYLLLVIVPLVILLVLFSEIIVTKVLGNEFLPSAPILSIFSLSIFILLISRFYGYILYAIEKHAVLPIISLVTTVFFLIFFLFLVPKSFLDLPTLGLGARGAAWASVSALLLNAIMVLFFVWKYTKIKPHYGVFVNAAVGGADYLVVTYVIKNFNLDIFNPFTVILLTIGVFANFIILLFLIRYIKKEDVGYLINLLNFRKLAKDSWVEFKGNPK